MDASQLFGTIIRILNQPVFPPKAKSAHAGKPRPNGGRPHLNAGALQQAAVRSQAATPSVPTGLAPITVIPASMSAPIPVRAPATTQAMRTLEEVKADLARLRDQAKRRQAANAQARREQAVAAFAPTDFMEYGKPLAPAKQAAQASSRAFAPTDFMDFNVEKPS